MYVSTYSRERRVHIVFPYSPEAIAAVKELPGAKYHPADRSWSISERYSNRLPDALGTIDAIFDCLRIEAAKAIEKEAIRAEKEARALAAREAELAALADRHRAAEAASAKRQAEYAAALVQMEGNPLPETDLDIWVDRFAPVWRLTTPYDDRIVEAMRSIEGAKWDRMMKSWSVPFTSRDEFAAAFPVLSKRMAWITLYAPGALYADAGTYKVGSLMAVGPELRIVSAVEPCSSYGEARVRITHRFATVEEAKAARRTGFAVDEHTHTRVNIEIELN